MRAKKSLWQQIEATFKQMDTAATELECFRVLQKQEQLAASHRINNIWAEVEKQKELEKILQKRYGNLLAEVERIQNMMNQYRAHSNHEEEVAAKKRSLELAEIASEEMSMQGIENHESISHPDEHGSEVLVNSTHDETPVQQLDLIQTETTSGPKNDKDVDADKEQMTRDSDVKLQDATPVAEEGVSATPVPGKSIDSCIAHRETALDTGDPEDTRSIDRCGEDQDLKNPDNAPTDSHDDKIPD